MNFMGDYLASDTFAGRFYRVNDEVKGCAESRLEDCHLTQALRTAQEQHAALTPYTMKDVAAVLCAGGGSSAMSHRPELTPKEGKPYTRKGDGVYLTFNHEKAEDYLRDGMPMDGGDFDAHGIHYLATNNANHNAQIYTYSRSLLGPMTTKLTTIFANMPDSFKSRAGYSTKRESVKLTGEGLEGAALKWFLEYRAILLDELEVLQVPLPEQANVNVYYAERSEWYWRNAVEQARCNVPGEGDKLEVDVPVIYLGDAAACTDYWKGQSLSRGLLASAELAKLIALTGGDMAATTKLFQYYWENVVDTEMDKTAKIATDPAIMFKYHVVGRKLIKEDGEIIQFKGDMLDTYKKMLITGA